MPCPIYASARLHFFRKYGISFHCYAEDTLIYIPLKGQDSTTIKCLLNCLEDVKAWMALHFLSFNDSKTEFILLRPGTTCNTNALKSYTQCLMTLIYLWAFPIIGYCVGCCLELTFVYVLVRHLASRINCSYLSPWMLTLNFQTLNFAAEFGMLNFGTIFYINIYVECLILNFLTLKNKAEYDLLSSIQSMKSFTCGNMPQLKT